MKFKNMKIEITQNQSVIAVVKELEKQGYVKHQWSESINTGVVLVFDNGLFTNNSYHYPIRNLPLFSLSDLEAERHG
jgi:hypothetical protein